MGFFLRFVSPFSSKFSLLTVTYISLFSQILTKQRHVQVHVPFGQNLYPDFILPIIASAAHRLKSLASKSDRALWTNALEKELAKSISFVRSCPTSK